MIRPSRTVAGAPVRSSPKLLLPRSTNSGPARILRGRREQVSCVSVSVCIRWYPLVRRLGRALLLRLGFIERFWCLRLGFFNEGKRIKHNLIPFLQTRLDDNELVVAVAEPERTPFCALG